MRLEYSSAYCWILSSGEAFFCFSPANDVFDKGSNFALYIVSPHSCLAMFYLVCMPYISSRYIKPVVYAKQILEL